MNHPLAVSIIYAPSPDEPAVSDQEDFAAYQYACRAKESLLKLLPLSNTNVTISCIQESSFEEIILTTCTDENVNETTSPKRMLCLLILSCSADGSIHRLLRKATKRLGQDGSSSSSPSNRIMTQSIPLAVALLGHARCDNSAKQMNQTIFGSGRRIEKALLTTTTGNTSGDHGGFIGIQDRLETQVELVGPEVDFDPWWNSVIGQC
mmetsp:Transcript_32856/g.79527  ORF Transcript_32856/g.79527 Transcript_32856/m.79527 type:complete len:207 (-) Transcript_32856:120-740(-)